MTETDIQEDSKEDPKEDVSEGQVNPIVDDEVKDKT